MARQSGILKIKGTIGGMTFYKSQDGNLVREKGGVDASKIANDPAFARTRENGSEFGSAASAGKLLRDAVRTLMLLAADNRVTSRVTKVMTVIKNFDTASARGDRNVAAGLADPAAQAELKNFNFNISALLSSVLYKPFAVNTATGVITINNLIPMNDLSFPNGATHIAIRGAWTKIDFDANTSEIEYTNVVNLPIDGASSNVVLTPAAVPAGAGGISLFLLGIEFFQDVNGVQYTLKNGAYNTLAIVEVV